MDKMIIANRIKMLRNEKKMKQQDLSDKMRERGIKTTRVAISKWECGKHTPETPSLNALSEIFGVSMNYLSGQSDRRDGLFVRANDTPSDLHDLDEYDAYGNKIDHTDEEYYRAKLLNCIEDLPKEKFDAVYAVIQAKCNPDKLKEIIQLCEDKPDEALERIAQMIEIMG